MAKLRILIFAVMILAGLVVSEEAPVSEESQTCLECHATLHPGIVGGWKMSRHSRITTGQALANKGIGLRISSQSVPTDLKSVAVGCAECHSLRPKSHKDTFEHNGYRIHVVVSPRDCATCHAQEVNQFSRNLMAHAYGNLLDNNVYRQLIRSINHAARWEHGRLTEATSDRLTGEESCLYCHGTELKLKRMAVRDTEYGEMNFPVIEGWPNGGTGRINLDGSLGSCASCHHRHRFSIESARKPHTCKKCHEGPDVPAYKVYQTSKHGNIYSAHRHTWDFKSVPWRIGRDFTAPTCAACHMSLLVNGDGEIVVNRTHEVKDRLSYRILGLIYAHPHPRNADTSIIRNQNELPLPTGFSGDLAESFLLNSSEQERNRRTMQKSCLACHDGSWVDGHWKRLNNTITQTNLNVLAATRIMQEIWKEGLAHGLRLNASPFDEYIEKKWIAGWLFFANSIRFASAMAGGGDFGVFANGRYQLAENLKELLEWLRVKRMLRDSVSR